MSNEPKAERMDETSEEMMARREGEARGARGGRVTGTMRAGREEG